MEFLVGAVASQNQPRGEVLLIGSDPELLRTRWLILARAGAQVLCESPSPSHSLLKERHFAVVVLCHTLSQQERMSLCQSIFLNYPDTRVIAMLASEDALPEDDARAVPFPWVRGPARLAQMVRSFAGLCTGDASPFPI